MPMTRLTLSGINAKQRPNIPDTQNGLTVPYLKKQYTISRILYHIRIQTVHKKMTQSRDCVALLTNLRIPQVAHLIGLGFTMSLTALRL